MRIHRKVVAAVFCPECKKSYANLSNMKQHFERQHKGMAMGDEIDAGPVANKGNQNNYIFNIFFRNERRL